MLASERGFVVEADPAFYARAPAMNAVRASEASGLVPVDASGDRLLARVADWERSLVDSMFRNRKCARLGWRHRYEYERAFVSCIRHFGDRKGLRGTASDEPPSEDSAVSCVTVIVTRDGFIHPVMRWGPARH